METKTWQKKVKKAWEEGKKYAESRTLPKKSFLMFWHDLIILLDRHLNKNG